MMVVAILTASLSLAAAVFFGTLFRAYTYTGRAQADRLAEKYPAMRRKVEFWAPRWEELCSTLQLLMVASRLLFVIAAVLLLTRQDVSPSVWLGAAVALSLLCLFLLELLPDALAAAFSDRISARTLPLTSLVAVCVRPLAWSLACAARLLRRAVSSGSVEEDRPTHEEAILSMVGPDQDSDLEAEEKQIIRSALEFSDTVAREIMTPRVDVIGLEDSTRISEAVSIIRRTGRSRYPVFHEDMDDILGVVHVKDLLVLLGEGKGSSPVISAVKPVPFVPESIPISDLLQLLRSQQVQLAVIVDEYGGTSGVVTIEDILEELVGEIHDEYDVREVSARHLPDGSVVISARTPVSEANTLAAVHIPEGEDYDSVGGYIFSVLGRIPRAGETVDGEDFTLTVQAADQRQIHLVRITPKHTPASAAT
ncbi:MAG TPA: HlyC/CorC family transporter [Kiritimatiellae bacterium]|nr:HlyC/CorC family transporter [Kiritimatiellia bacterium]